MPRPVSQTSIRTAPARRRQPTSTRPFGVYLIALETRFCNRRRISRRSERTASDVGDEGQLQPLGARHRRELDLELAEHVRERDVGDLRPRRAGVEPGDVEQRAEDFLDRLERGVDVARQLDALLAGAVGRGLGQRARVEPRRVERLQDVVARGGEKARFGEIGVLGRGLGARELAVEPLEFRRALLHAPLQPLVGGGEFFLGLRRSG